LNEKAKYKTSYKEKELTDNRSLQNLKEAILKDYDRLGLKDSFSFNCYPGVSCFNQCCSDVNIFLTPYDVLRLKRRLNLFSWDFLAQYTLTPLEKNLQYPVLLLKMRDNPQKSCPFVEAGGCSVYSDRPWACRMYPIGLASPKDESQLTENDFYFLLKEEVCKGFAEANKSWSVKEWMINQGVPQYDEFGRLFKELTLHPFLQGGKALNPAKMEMFHMVCYNLDKFRGFLFNTSFFQRFEVEEALIKRLQVDDEELLKFGFKWLKFSLYGENTIIIKPEAQKKVLYEK